MKLQTQIPLGKQTENQIDYQSKMLLLGSCFVENIGQKLDYFKFQNLQNPLGILFHPEAIETLIFNAIHEKKYTEEDVFFHNEQWHCFDAHSKLSDVSKEHLIHSLNEKLQLTFRHLKTTTHVLITFGTAWMYAHTKSNLPVANCHKVPQNQFVKQLLSAEEIFNSINMMVELIHQVNSNAQIIFTVSPVRHIKDGFVENTQSKAHLISAIHKFLNQQSLIENHQSFYFPSYEIMLDELRDYRFYGEDMLHPNNTAVNYIWEKFKLVWIAYETEKIMTEVDYIQKGLQHKPFNSSSEAHQNFLKVLEHKKHELLEHYSHMTF